MVDGIDLQCMGLGLVDGYVDRWMERNLIEIMVEKGCMDVIKEIEWIN